MIYLDHSATTKPYEEAIQSYITVSQKYFANPSSIHKLGGESEKLLYHSRKAIADMLFVKPQEILFTSGGTEGNNLAIKGAALRNSKRGKHVITTSVEHASVMKTFQQLEEMGFSVTYLPVNEEGRICVQKLKDAIREDTILVSIMHVNNEVGTIQPIKEIGKLLKNYSKIIFHVDDVQGFAKVPLSINECHIDLYTISGHKFHSVKGSGVLFVREGVKLSPLLTGGAQENLLRAGTENLPAIVAMTKAMRLSLEASKKEMQKVQRLKSLMRNEIGLLTGAVINTPIEASAPHILNVSFIGLKPEVLVHELEKYEVYVSTQSACSSKQNSHSKTLTEMNVPKECLESAIRISLSLYTTFEEVHEFLEILQKSLQNLETVRKVSRT